MANLLIFVGAVLAITAAVSGIPNIHEGFEFIGTVEGKVFVMPIANVNNTHNSLTYQQAIASCASAGYQIATLESAAQNSLIEESGGASRWSWIDGVSFQDYDNFFSINTGKNLTYFNWSKWGNRPIKGSKENNCVRISRNSFEVGWWDVTCTDKYSVICQIFA